MVKGPAYSGAVFGYAVANGRFLVDRRTWSPTWNSGAFLLRLLVWRDWSSLAFARLVLTCWRLVCIFWVLMSVVSGSSGAGFTISLISLGLCPNAISKGVALREESLVLFRTA